MKKSLKLTAIFLVLASSNAFSKSDTPWYGLMTVGNIPFSNCEVIQFLPISYDIWTTNASGKQLTDQISADREKLISQLKNSGWHGMLGYRVFSSIGGAALPIGRNHSGGTDYSGLLSGTITISGVAVKTHCK